MSGGDACDINSIGLELVTGGDACDINSIGLELMSGGDACDIAKLYWTRTNVRG